MQYYFRQLGICIHDSLWSRFHLCGKFPLKSTRHNDHVLFTNLRMALVTNEGHFTRSVGGSRFHGSVFRTNCLGNFQIGSCVLNNLTYCLIWENIVEINHQRIYRKYLNFRNKKSRKIEETILFVRSISLGDGFLAKISVSLVDFATNLKRIENWFLLRSIIL